MHIAVALLCSPDAAKAAGTIATLARQAAQMLSTDTSAPCHYESTKAQDASF